MKVITNQINEVRINHLMKTNIDNLTKERAIFEKPLCWCKGYLFYYEEDECDSIVEQMIKGIWYIDSFFYAKCEKRIEQSKWNGHSIEVLDFTGHSDFEKIIDSLEAEK